MEGKAVDEMELAIEILMKPPVRWQELADMATSPEQAQERVRNLMHIAQFAARAAEYFDCRYRGFGHAPAVRAQNKRAEKVRQAMGYTQPKMEIDF